MPQLIVTAKRLNKRKVIPFNFPDPASIIGEVLKGSSFEGVEVNESEIPNKSLGKWYRDRDGHFYWGGGLVATPSFLAGAESVPQEDWWIKSLNLASIWQDFNERGNRAKIAILDSGFNTNIPDLVNGIKESKIFFTSVAGNPITINDTFGHGSHCASLIGGRNRDNITGCAPEAEIFVAKICSQGSVRSFSIMVDAIKWAIEKKVDVISISYGGESSDDGLTEIINTAVNEHKIICIASIGDVIPNSANSACFPALLNQCIAVGATDAQNKIAPVTVIDNKTEINAPGDNILGYSLSNQLEPKTGTSQAAAIVAGICGLIISRHKNLGKNYTVESIRSLILHNSDEVADLPNQKIISPLKIFSKI